MVLALALLVGVRWMVQGVGKVVMVRVEGRLESEAEVWMLKFQHLLGPTVASAVD